MIFLGVLAAVVALAFLSRTAGTTTPPPRINPSVMADVLRWRGIVERESERPHLSPALVLAVIARESRGDPGAAGPVAEVGLMQLTEGAWQDYQTENDDPASIPFPDALLSPDINVRVGAWFLNRKIEQTGTVHEGLRAYNCGVRGARENPNCGQEYADWITMVGLPQFRAALV